MARIRLDRSGPVITLTLDRPDQRNALDTAMLDALHDFCVAPVEPEARLVVVRAAGPSFCAGIDLKERQRQSARNPDTLSQESPVMRVFHAMEAHPLPFVAVVHGAAIAGGCELALHCDLVIADEAAPFGMSLSQVGLAPTWALTEKLLQLAGPALTREILLLGNPVPARELARLGVISRAVPSDELPAAADAAIARLCANAPLSLRAIKATINRGLQYRAGIAHDDVDALVHAARTSADAREGIAARLEKRAPSFKGH